VKLGIAALTTEGVEEIEDVRRSRTAGHEEPDLQHALKLDVLGVVVDPDRSLVGRDENALDPVGEGIMADSTLDPPKLLRDVYRFLFVERVGDAVDLEDDLHPGEARRRP